MDLKEELTRQSFLLEFISACVSLQSVPEMVKLITARLRWICDYDSYTVFLPDAQGLSLWSQGNKVGTPAVVADDVVLSNHKTALTDAMARGAPTVAYNDERGIFLAALPLGSSAMVHGALCVARTERKYSQGDVRHLQHASSAIGGALTRIAALAAEHEAEHAIKLVESQLRDAAEDRVLLAEQMVGIVSHDLRNPLSAILMGTTLMGMGSALPIEKQQVLRKVESAARRAQRMIEELLDFTQARVGKRLALKIAEVDIDALMASIVDELRLSFPNVELVCPDHPSGSAHIDADRIHQLLGNLVANGATYGAPGKAVRIKCVVTASELILCVHNEGDAIPQAIMAAMFDPMFRGPAHQTASRGVGLGLYIVRAIAEAHSGIVDATSSTENGTCFSVRLPVDSHAIECLETTAVG